MKSFLYKANAGRVLFGASARAALPTEMERLGRTRALILSTPQQEEMAREVATDLGDRAVAYFSGAAMHTPVDVTEQALSQLRAHDADILVAIGGGSTIGLGKALALRTGLDQLVVPTTYAGSEMTPILGQTEKGVKTTLNDVAVLPEIVIYDVDLTMSLPASLSGTSGINAIAHAIEALYARDSNPVVSLMALEGIAALNAALPQIAVNPTDRDAREQALYGAWLCGICLGSVGMALHHKLCHTLGGSFDLPHAETHTIVLPHALAYNAPAIPDVVARLVPILGADPAAGLFDLAGRVGAARALGALGMKETDVQQAAALALTNSYWNPRPLEKDGIETLLSNAWAGRRPAIEEA